MSRRSSSDAFAVVLVAIIYLAAFAWEYNTMVPHVALDAQNVSWYNGLLHGWFAVPNFIVNLFSGNPNNTVFQTGGGGWYTFWYFVGIGALLKGATER